MPCFLRRGLLTAHLEYMDHRSWLITSQLIVDQHQLPLVIYYYGGVFKNRPPTPPCTFIWHVEKVFKHQKQLSAHANMLDISVQDLWQNQMTKSIFEFSQRTKPWQRNIIAHLLVFHQFEQDQSMSVTYIFTTNPVMGEMVIRKNNLSCIRQSCRNYNGKFSESDFENSSNWHKAIQATFCKILLFPMLVCWVWRIKIFLAGKIGLLSPLGKNLFIRILTITRNWLALNWRRCATIMNAWLGEDIIPFHSHQSLGFCVGYKFRGGYYDYHHAWLWK